MIHLSSIILSFLSFSVTVTYGDYVNNLYYDLYDSYIYASFSGYSTASFNLDAIVNEIDFWIVDQDGFNAWKNSGTPPTTKLYTGSYCNDCTNFDYTFTLTDSTKKYYFVVASLFPGSQATGYIYLNFKGSGTTSDITEAEDTGCFASNSLIHLKNGTSIPIQLAQIGDEILSATYFGTLVYSPIIHIPHHPDNTLKGKFLTITTQSSDGISSQLSLTKDHLLPICSQADCSLCSFSVLSPSVLMSVSKMTVGMCLLQIETESSTGNTMKWSKIQSILPLQTSKGQGMYTVITSSPYPVINGVISSPFSLSHIFPSMFYSLHDVLYHLQLLNDPIVQRFFQQLSQSWTILLSSKSFQDAFSMMTKI